MSTRPPALRCALLALFVSACGEPPGGAPVPPAARAPGAPASAAEAAPRIAFEAPTHDFGRVSDVGLLRHAFRFENAGRARLVITDVKASCGCTTTRLARTSFEPGEGDVIEVEWDPKGFDRQTKTVTVTSNSGGGERTVLSIQATLEPFVRVQPMVLKLGRVRMGEEHVARAALTCDDPALEVLSVESSNPLFVAQVVPGQAGARTLEVMLLSSAPWGAAFSTLTVRVRGRLSPEAAPVEHEVEVTCHAQVSGEVAVEPSIFAVGRVDPGAEFRFVVGLSRAGGAPFQVLDARVDQATPADMRVTAEPVPPAQGGGWRLVLEGAAGAHLGNIRGRVSFLTDVPGEVERSLPVMGIVRALEPHEQPH